MKLRGIDFGRVFLAPGTLGFCREGYWFHSVLRRLRVDLDTPTLTAKTVTLHENAGNMPLHETSWQPEELFPRCIKTWWRSGHTVNAVGLSNPGADKFFRRLATSQVLGNFFVSFMAKGKETSERLDQLQEFVEQPFLRELLHTYRGRIGLQLNFACPNTKISPEELYKEIEPALLIASTLELPLVANLNPLTPVEVLKQVEHVADAFWIANTVPWGATDEIDWKKLTKDGRSPLPKRLGKASEYDGYKGGLSGPMCLPLTEKLVRKAREAEIKKPIIAGNGVQSAADVTRLWLAGASGIAIGTAYMLRAWRVNRIIAQARIIDSLWDVPFLERESKYPHLVSCHQLVPASR